MEDPNHDEEPLSRSQLKKRKKYEALQQHWKEKKLQRKLKKKQQKAKEVKEENDPSPEERARLKEEHRRQKEQWLVDLKTSPRILIDLDFKEFMRDNEISSLCQQVMYSYGMIRRAPKPLRLCLSSVNGIIKEKLEKIQGFSNWYVDPFESDFMTKNNDDSSYSYPKDHIIYLSADAEEVLTELDSSYLYIIGGIVDRNRYKNLTFDKAKRLGIRTAKLMFGYRFKFRLPLDQIKFSGSRVLTVNNGTSESKN
ncbi:hypothetical protein WA171_002424 [Blastocystis sp. BT1]